MNCFDVGYSFFQKESQFKGQKNPLKKHKKIRKIIIISTKKLATSLESFRKCFYQFSIDGLVKYYAVWNSFFQKCTKLKDKKKSVKKTQLSQAIKKFRKHNENIQNLAPKI